MLHALKPVVHPRGLSPIRQHLLHVRALIKHPPACCHLFKTAAAGVQEVTVQFNLCNEPWLKYNMLLVADQGLRRQQWTSARLHRDALYLETAGCALLPALLSPCTGTADF